MGQELSIKAANGQLPLSPKWITDKFNKHFHTIKELNALSYDEFKHEVTLLNDILVELTANKDRTVQFLIKPGSATTMLWKATAKIICEKIVSSTNQVISSKTLSVPRFVRLYADVMHQIAANSSAVYVTDNTRDNELTASLIMDGIDDVSSIGSEPIEECCICMERGCEVMLPCTHGYCECCIEEWSQRGKPAIGGSTCPQCRDPVRKADDHWVLAARSSVSHDEMPDVVMGLVEKAEGRQMGEAALLMRQQTEDISRTLEMIPTPEDYTLVSHCTPETDNSAPQTSSDLNS